jgi:CDP-glucose 4,6-dehydratase
MESMVSTLSSSFADKKVIVTGHTGFKGSWLTQWLVKMGAEVYGISDTIPSEPSMYVDNCLASVLKADIRGDVTDNLFLSHQINNIEPDFIFHLAAQAIVSTSYIQPLETFKTNVLGYAVLLDVLRDVNFPCVAILVSSDKCYKNREWIWGYRENDEFGGKDPYSASKAACEIVFESYYYSFFKNSHPCKIASVRAGNVLGGGDWSKDRLIPDIFKAWMQNKEVVLRRPDSVRPWQFVLEPLLGYLLTAYKLSSQPQLSGSGFNFGPDSGDNFTVLQIVDKLKNSFINGSYTVNAEEGFYETSLLMLNTDKAKRLLSWKPTLSIDETLNLITDWYSAYETNVNQFELTQQQIAFFENKISKL